MRSYALQTVRLLICALESSRHPPSTLYSHSHSHLPAIPTICSEFKWPTAFAASVARFDSIAMQHDAVFIGGRYCKLNRHLSQSPWIIEADADIGDASTVSASARDVECDDVCEDAEAPANGSLNGSASASSAACAPAAPTSASASAPASASPTAGVESQQHYSPHTLPTSIEALIGEPCVRATRAASFRCAQRVALHPSITCTSV